VDTGLVPAASSSGPPTSVGLACRPVGAWRRHLVKQGHSTERTTRRRTEGTNCEEPQPGPVRLGGGSRSEGVPYLSKQLGREVIKPIGVAKPSDPCPHSIVWLCARSAMILPNAA
jgi:hypothetical protein